MIQSVELKSRTASMQSDDDLPSPGALSTILWAGILAGTLDITDALVFSGLRGVAPVRVLQYIASGLLGPRSFQGGLLTAALGAFLHYVIAFSAACIFYVASRRLASLTRRPIVWGLTYGAVVYAVMNVIVLPLSAVHRPRGAATGISLVNGVLAVVLLVGLPISLIVRRHSETKEVPAP